MKKKISCVLLSVVFALSLAGCKENEEAKQIEELKSLIAAQSQTILALSNELAELQTSFSELEQEVEILKEKNGSFYTLEQAYCAGFITQADLLSIAYYQNENFEIDVNKTLMGENYIPTEKTALSETLQQTICEKFYEHFVVPMFNEYDYVSFDSIEIDMYYGRYGDCFVVRMKDNFGHTGNIRHCVIAGVEYIYTSGNEIIVWNLYN